MIQAIDEYPVCPPKDLLLHNRTDRFDTDDQRKWWDALVRLSDVLSLTMEGAVEKTTGKYKKTENEDGDIVVEISAADSIIYTTSGMFFYQFQWGVDGMEDSTFPVALMGSSSASDTLDFFKSEYGYAYSFLTTDSNSLIKELNLPDDIAAHYATKDASGEETGDSSSAE